MNSTALQTLVLITDHQFSVHSAENVRILGYQFFFNDLGSKTVKVLARDVQRNPLKGFILHADFFAIDADSTIVTAVPIQFVGESPAVETGKGILMIGANSINVETLPSNLINIVEVDLSNLEKVGDTITVGDLNLGDDVVILSDPEEPIVRVAQSAAARRQEMLDSGLITEDSDEEAGQEETEE